MKVNQYIEADLRRLLGAGQLPSCGLGLEAMARHYGVSTRPVRTAVDRLVEDNLLSRGAGRQLNPAKRGGRRPAHREPDSTPFSAVSDPYRQIADGLITRGLGGQDTYLREQATAAQFGISTTVVREVFSRLVGEGVLEHVARRGWRLKPLRQKDLDDFGRVREAMELLAMELSWGRLDHALLRDIDAGNRGKHAGDPPAEPDNRLHLLMVEAADNRYISDFFARHGRYYELLFTWEARDPAASAQACRQHRAILRAMLQGDRAAAERALRRHLRCQHPGLERLIAANDTRMDAEASD